MTVMEDAFVAHHEHTPVSKPVTSCSELIEYQYYMGVCMNATHHAIPYPLHGSSSDNSKHIVMKKIYIPKQLLASLHKLQIKIYCTDAMSTRTLLNQPPATNTSPLGRTVHAHFDRLAGSSPALIQFLLY